MRCPYCKHHDSKVFVERFDGPADGGDDVGTDGGGDDAQLHFRQGKLGSAGGDGHVAHAQQAHTAGHGMAVHPGDQRVHFVLVHADILPHPSFRLPAGFWGERPSACHKLAVMVTLDLPPDEAQRLARLAALCVMDTEPEPLFDHLAALAAQICGTPVALLGLVDERRQWFKASVGFGREIFGWTDKRGTRWKIGWMPLGGYVKFAGDMNAVSQPSAEWLALRYAAAIAIAAGASDVLFIGDARTIVEQALGRWACRSPQLRPHRDAWLQARKGFDRVHVRHVPRSKNLAGIALARRHPR
mgnify:CR=1 FL=1